MVKAKRTPSFSAKLRYFLRRRWLYILVIGVLLTLLPFVLHHNDRTTPKPIPTVENDVLVYRVDRGELGTAPLQLYDPRTHTSTPILPESASRHVSVSINGHLAFSYEGEVFVRETLLAESRSVQITNNHIGSTPRSWSPDGRYLAYAGYGLYVWDSETQTTIDISPSSYDVHNEEAGYGIEDVAWSLDGRIAFTVRYGYMGPTEIFVWDGQVIRKLYQRADSSTYQPLWSPDNQLAFYFYLRDDDRRGLAIWDGVSLHNGSPNAATFALLSHYQTGSFSWIPDGRLAFSAQMNEGDPRTIYIWDGETRTTLTHHQAVTMGNPAWSSNGLWAFTSINQREWLLYIQDTTNNTLFTSEGRYPPAWSSNNTLAFCQVNSLALWDGNEAVPIAGAYKGGYIVGQWQSGAVIFCSRFADYW
jgi:hypothetical protein